MKKKIIALALVLCLATSGLVGCGDEDKQSSEMPTEYAVVDAVYVTKTGKKYHTQDCQYVKDSCYAMDREEANDKGYTPCSRCNP